MENTNGKTKSPATSQALTAAPLTAQVIDLTSASGGSTVDDTKIHSIEYVADGAIQRGAVTRRTQDRAIGRELARQLRGFADASTLKQWIVDGVMAVSEIPEGNSIPLKLRAIVALRYDGKLPRPGDVADSSDSESK